MSNPYGQNIDDDQSYKRLNNQYGPIDRDIRNSNDAFAAQLNPLVAKRQSYHIRSLISFFILIIGQTTILSLYFTDVIQVEVGQLAGICAGIYVFYLLLGLICNPLFSYLGNIDHGCNLEKQYNKIRNIIGYFQFHATCYHYQTRYHTRTVKDADGTTRTQTYTTQQKVVTHTANQNLNCKKTFDDSGSVDKVRASTDIIFLHMLVSYRFKDERSRYIFQRQWQSFRNRNRRDAYQDYNYKYLLPGLKERMTFYVGDRPKNYRAYFILFSLLGFIWPVSMYIEGKVSRFIINFMKILTM